MGHVTLACATIAHLDDIVFTCDASVPPHLLPAGVPSDAVAFATSAITCVLYELAQARYYRVALAALQHTLPSVSALVCYHVTLSTNLPAEIADDGSSSLGEALKDQVERKLISPLLPLGLADAPGREARRLADAGVFLFGSDEAQLSGLGTSANDALQAHLERSRWASDAPACLYHRLNMPVEYWLFARYMPVARAAALATNDAESARHLAHALDTRPARLWLDGVLDAPAFVLALTQRPVHTHWRTTLERRLCERFPNSCDPRIARGGDEWPRCVELWELVAHYYRHQLLERCERLALVTLTLPNRWELLVLESLSVVSCEAHDAGGVCVTLDRYRAWVLQVRASLAAMQDVVVASVPGHVYARAEALNVVCTPLPLPTDTTERLAHHYAHIVPAQVIELCQRAVCVSMSHTEDDIRQLVERNALTTNNNNNTALYMLLNAHLWTAGELARFLTTLHSSLRRSRADFPHRRNAYTLVVHACPRQTQRGALALIDSALTLLLNDGGACSVRRLIDASVCEMTDSLTRALSPPRTLRSHDEVLALWKSVGTVECALVPTHLADTATMPCDIVFRGWELLTPGERHALAERTVSVRVDANTAVDTRTLLTLTTCSVRPLLQLVATTNAGAD